MVLKESCYVKRMGSGGGGGVINWLLLSKPPPPLWVETREEDNKEGVLMYRNQ